MLTPVNVQPTTQGSASTSTKSSSDGDNGFGALLSDTRARRQNDAGTSATATETRASATSRQQTHAKDADSEDKRSALKAGGEASHANERLPLQADNAHRALSGTQERFQNSRLDGRESRGETSLQQGDRPRTPLSEQTSTDDTRRAGLAALAGGRQPLEALSTERGGNRLAGMDRQMARRSDAETDALGDKGKRLADSEPTEDKSPLYALMDTGFLMQASPGQKASTGREGAMPARGAMLEQGLRGRNAEAFETASRTLKGGDNQDIGRSDRLFGDLLQQREGPLFRAGGTGAAAMADARTGASSTSDSPLNALSALTGQTTASPMTPNAAQAVTTATLPAMDSDQWSSALERQTISLSMKGGGEARLNMNPLELGPLSISLKMGEQSAQLHIASHHAQVRAAVEAALPQLRDAFSASGIELGQTSVSDQGSFQQGGFQQQQERTPGALAAHDASGTMPGISAEADSDVISITTPIGRALNGGIDLFA
ncbi:flagellar hook-length control protein FliK [Kushneria sp. AK178]